ncbi:homogentisate 1,2-dioxygenase [Panus rudis PR-1116 ss-1]|nr:homogentisate 1,2-dioxygenase [Panus rudis PR-1116 ss-1]
MGCEQAKFTGATAQTGWQAGPRDNDPYRYQVGYGNLFASEAVPGTLPEGRNNPQRLKYGLYPEQVNGSPFVNPRATNKKVWLYRIQPSVQHNGFTQGKQNPFLVSDFSASNTKAHANPTQIFWPPFKLPDQSEKVDFIAGWKTVGGVGGARLHEGFAVHMYLANADMEKKAFVDSDGDLLLVPEQGRLDIKTEMGSLMVRPGEIAVIQAGLKFQVFLPDGPSRGYIQEIYNAHYELPELGPLGANGMANPRDFEHPIASFDVDRSDWEVVYQITGEHFTCHLDHSPFDVVAWHGNYVPYKYDLSRFKIAGFVNNDHGDPSVLCVLTVKSKYPNVALSDFCVLSQRWEAMEDTYRPPYFHRNTACELVGFIKVPSDGGLRAFHLPGGLSYQSSFTPHGPPASEHKAAVEKDLKPEKYMEGTLGFLFEPGFPMVFTEWALQGQGLEDIDVGLWKELTPDFLTHIDEIKADSQKAAQTVNGVNGVNGHT